MTDSPDFTPPQLVGPYLKALSPNAYEVQVETRDQSALLIRLRFEVASEDLNRDPGLQADVIIDFPGFGLPYPDQLDHRLTPRMTILAGHLDQPREITTPPFSLKMWPEGCHSVTVIVTHKFDDSMLTSSPAMIDGKIMPVDQITWWYLVGQEAADQGVALRDCVSKQQSSAGDAGADAQPRSGP